MLIREKQIISRFVDGDPEAFDYIYSNYSRKILHFAKGFIKDHDTAWEIVQDVFVNLWEKREQVNVSLNFDNYLFTITYNSIRKSFRKRAVEIRVNNHLLRNAPELIENADSHIIYNELMEIATSAIDRLPPRRKIVYKLSRQEGMKIKEIASRLNISQRTAETHLSKALKFLKEELSKASLLSLLYFHLFIG